MKVAVIADTHWGVRNDHPAIIESQSRFFSEVFFPELAKRDIKHVFHLGDVFDRRKYVNIGTAKAAWENMTAPLLESYKTYAIVGNHDCYHKNTNKLNSVRTLYGSLDMTIIDGPCDLKLDGVDFMMMPWIPEDEDAKREALKALEDSKASICLGHLELSGFDMYRGVEGHGGLSPSLFGKFKTVLSGHYHTRSTKGNITYVGAAGQYTWSDYDDARGFCILDTDTHDLEFIDNPFESFCKVHYDDQTDAEADIVRDVETADAQGKFVKLIVRNKTNNLLFERVVDMLEMNGVKDLQVVDDHFHANDVSDEEIAVDVGDTLVLIETMIDRVGRPDLADRAKHLVRDLYHEAKAQE